MTKQIVIAEQHRIAAVFSEDQIQELVVATGSHQVSDIYLGKVPVYVSSHPSIIISHQLYQGTCKRSTRSLRKGPNRPSDKTYANITIDLFRCRFLFHLLHFLDAVQNFSF